MTPFETLYDGPAYAVSSLNTDGKFDILAEHANFITLIEKQPIVLTMPDKVTTQKYEFTQAIIYDLNNLVSIYADPQKATL